MTAQIAMTTGEIDALAKELRKWDLEAKERKRYFEIANAEKLKLQDKLLAVLESQEKDRWDIDGVVFRVKPRFSIRVPQTRDDLAKLFNYLKSRDRYWEYAKVDSRSLPKLFREEEEFQRETNGVLDFTLPGCPEPNEYTTLSIESKK